MYVIQIFEKTDISHFKLSNEYRFTYWSDNYLISLCFLFNSCIKKKQEYNNIGYKC